MVLHGCCWTHCVVLKYELGGLTQVHSAENLWLQAGLLDIRRLKPPRSPIDKVQQMSNVGGAACWQDCVKALCSHLPRRSKTQFLYETCHSLGHSFCHQAESASLAGVVRGVGPRQRNVASRG